MAIPLDSRGGASAAIVSLLEDSRRLEQMRASCGAFDKSDSGKKHLFTHRQPRPRRRGGPRMKLLVLYALAGGGHLSAARALKALMEKNNPGLEVELQDATVPLGRAFDFCSCDLYRFSAKYVPRAFGFCYRMTDRRSGGSRLMRTAALPFARRLLPILREKNADVIVCAYPLACELVSVLKEKGLLQAENDPPAHRLRPARRVDHALGGRLCRFLPRGGRRAHAARRAAAEDRRVRDSRAAEVLRSPRTAPRCAVRSAFRRKSRCCCSWRDRSACAACFPCSGRSIACRRISRPSSSRGGTNRCCAGFRRLSRARAARDRLHGPRG